MLKCLLFKMFKFLERIIVIKNMIESSCRIYSSLIVNLDW